MATNPKTKKRSAAVVVISDTFSPASGIRHPAVSTGEHLRATDGAARWGRAARAAAAPAQRLLPRRHTTGQRYGASRVAGASDPISSRLCN